MRILTSQHASDQFTNLIHLETQASDHGIDLTVAEVHRLTGPGSLDFGGSEFEAAPHERISPQKRNPDDDYGWWDLKAGRYVVQYNEGIDPGPGVAVVYPHRRLLLAGGHHPAFTVQEDKSPLTGLLIVGNHGLHLKENGRISTAILFGPEDGLFGP
jgi:hypothetical protein